MFLFHDGSLDLPSGRARLCDMLWADVSAVKLPDGSSPPLLSSVIDSVASPTLTLYVELKSQESASQLARTLKDNHQLLSKMQFIFISFSLFSLKILRQSFEPAMPLCLLWLVDNPRIPYPPEALDDGELTFDIGHGSFEEFLVANNVLELFLEVAPDGLGIQYVHARCAICCCVRCFGQSQVQSRDGTRLRGTTAAAATAAATSGQAKRILVHVCAPVAAVSLCVVFPEWMLLGL